MSEWQLGPLEREAIRLQNVADDGTLAVEEAMWRVALAQARKLLDWMEGKCEHTVDNFEHHRCPRLGCSRCLADLHRELEG